MQTSTACQCWVKISFSRPLPDCRATSTGSSSPSGWGSRAYWAAFSSACCLKAGVSSSRSRMYRPISPSGPAIRKGSRQPQCTIPSWPRAAVSTVTMPEPSE